MNPDTFVHDHVRSLYPLWYAVWLVQGRILGDLIDKYNEIISKGE